ncbi:2-deoxystreptamine glucosyltransferase [Stieleria neptunia]|uniref:2-deoxystreptamine glucosyltransferase n=1 Tax=Stieleria neptunia TaxID=2527979 RepID=A0A518HTN1_9BACT|nr:glycosyltransferase family 4 protein [Stieleria neptunia]QDV44196.1 2-deoxystreptamine glucosyltransferase [Stieleria neptunia]
MKIVFFSHYFTPEGNAPASRTADHCSRWLREPNVDQVTVITCAPNVPDGKVYSGYKNRLWPQRETIDGVEVVRVWTLIQNSPGRIGLILNYLSYLVSALVAFVFFVRRPHVIVATTPQFFCGVTGVLASWLKWCPLVLEVRDIWPESIVTVGAIRRGVIIRALEWMERWMYRSADHIVTVGPGYRDNILSKVDVANRISMVTNGVDPKQFQPETDCASFSKRFELDGKFVCSYVGTVGMAHGLDVIVNAAQRFEAVGREDVVFLVVGGGAKLEEMRRTVAELGLGDLIRLTGRLDKSEIPQVLSASDACLVHLSKVDLFEHVIPSKIFETMAMERPIIMGVRGRALDIVLAAESGVAMEPENDAQLFEILDWMIGAPGAVRELGRNGRRFVIEHFNRDQLARDMLSIIRRTSQGDVFCLEDRDWGERSGDGSDDSKLTPVASSGGTRR